MPAALVTPYLLPIVMLLASNVFMTSFFVFQKC